MTNLKQELSKATDALKKQREEATEQKSRDTAEFQKMREVMRALKEQNDEVQIKLCLWNDTEPDCRCQPIAQLCNQIE